MNYITLGGKYETYFPRNKKEEGYIHLVDHKNQISCRHVGALIYFSQLARSPIGWWMDTTRGWQRLFCISSCLVILSSPPPLFGLEWMNMMKPPSSGFIIWTIRLTAGYCCCCSRLRCCCCWGVRRCIKSLRITLSETILINRALGQPFLVIFSVPLSLFLSQTRCTMSTNRRLSICLLILHDFTAD